MYILKELLRSRAPAREHVKLHNYTITKLHNHNILKRRQPAPMRWGGRRSRSQRRDIFCVILRKELLVIRHS